MTDLISTKLFMTKFGTLTVANVEYLLGYFCNETKSEQQELYKGNVGLM